MRKRHSISFFIILLITGMALTFGICIIVSKSADLEEKNDRDDQLALGIHYLEEMDYEAALVYFDLVLEIDDKNIAAYMGKALAYEQLENQTKAVEALEGGIAVTDNELLRTMRNDLMSGEKLSDQYRLTETKEKLNTTENPFDTLKLFGSEYYNWNFNACAGLFGFQYEEYMGKKEDLGSYQGLKLSLDAVTDDIRLAMENDDYIYFYKLLIKGQMQLFSIECPGNADNEPELQNMITCEFKMEMAYDDFCAAFKWNELDENVYYLADSNLGRIGYIQWNSKGKKYISLFLLNDEPLSLQATFVNEKLTEIVYSCGMPDNFRSKAMDWIGNLIN